MRHLGSLVLALVAGALIYVLSGISGSKWSEAMISDGGDKYAAFGITLAAALAAGGLYALLVLTRLSPLGLVLLGLLYLGVTMWAFFDESGFLDLMPRNILGVRGAGVAAVGPFTLILSVPLLATVLSPRRWRRWGNAPAAVAPAPNYSPPPMAPVPAYQQPSVPSAPSYPSPASGGPSYGSTYPSPSNGPGYPTSSPPSTYPSSAPPSNYPSSAPPHSPVSPAYGTPVSPAYGSPSYGNQGDPGGIHFPPIPPPGPGGDDPESTRRL